MTSINRRAVIVLGMHRSGTSAVSGVLQRLGVDFGESLLPAMKGVNDKGFYEHVKVLELHERILAALGYSWLDLRPLPDNWWERGDIVPFKKTLEVIIVEDFGASLLWGVKDPRMCRLLPLWLELLSDTSVTPAFVLSVRHPYEVAQSLKRRDGMEEEPAYCLWLWHVLESERHSYGMPRSVVIYPDFLQSWEETFNRVSDELHLEWPIPMAQAKATIDGFVDMSLHHHEVPKKAEPRGKFGRLAFKLFADLKKGILSSCDCVREEFLSELACSEFMLEEYNRANFLLAENTHIRAALEAEKKNANLQIECREALIRDLQKALESKEDLIDDLQKALESKEALIDDLQKALKSKEDLIDDLQKVLESRRLLLKRLVCFRRGKR